MPAGLPVLTLLTAAAWALCNEEWRWEAHWNTGSAGTLPRGAAPWIEVTVAHVAAVELRSAAGERVPVRRVGDRLVRLIPWWPLQPGARYEVWYAGKRAFEFAVGRAPDHAAPSGGELTGWSHEVWSSVDGNGDAWVLGVAPLDEPAWMELDVARGRDHVRFLRPVVQPDPTLPLARERMLATLSPEAVRSIGGLPAAVASFEYGPCGSTIPTFPPGAEGPVTARFRYLDAARNTTAWSTPILLD